MTLRFNKYFEALEIPFNSRIRNIDHASDILNDALWIVFHPQGELRVTIIYAGELYDARIDSARRTRPSDYFIGDLLSNYSIPFDLFFRQFPRASAVDCCPVD